MIALGATGGLGFYEMRYGRLSQKPATTANLASAPSAVPAQNAPAAAPQAPASVQGAFDEAALRGDRSRGARVDLLGGQDPQAAIPQLILQHLTHGVSTHDADRFPRL